MSLTSREQDIYAPPGSGLRKTLDAGDIEWPDRKTAAVELARGDLMGHSWCARLIDGLCECPAICEQRSPVSETTRPTPPGNERGES